MLPLTSDLADRESSEEIIRSLNRQKSSKRWFQHCLYLLSRCLSLIYHTTLASPGPTGSVASFVNSPDRSYTPLWSTLWTENQRWYAERPIELQQIYQIRGVDVSRIDSDSASQFPILVYTSTLALVASVVHHTTSLLLLNHKPRLAKTVALAQSSTSPIWHAQSIAGIAASNDFPEQWDPTFIAGLFLAAGSMSHVSQQSALIETFGRITAATGMNFDRKIAALRSAWSIAGDT